MRVPQMKLPQMRLPAVKRPRPEALLRPLLAGRDLTRLTRLPGALRRGADGLQSAARGALSRAGTRGGGSWPRRPALFAAVGYLALVLLLAHTAFSAVGGLLDKREAVATADEILGRLQGRRPPAADGSAPAGPPVGSPFLDGPSVTVAGANLMQRVGAAVAALNGRILSSRVELQGTDFGPGFVGVSVNFELAQSELQALLHDLEAGMPFLFVDQLVVQTPSASPSGGEAEAGRLRVLLSVYGQWQGAQ